MKKKKKNNKKAYKERDENSLNAVSPIKVKINNNVKNLHINVDVNVYLKRMQEEFC